MIQNTNQFNSVFGRAIWSAVDYVMSKMLETYREDIYRIVYGSNSPEEYQRTYQFAESWTAENKSIENGGEGKLYQDYSKMTFNPTLYQHGSPLSGSVVDSLAEIIFEGASGNMFGEGWWQSARDPWTPFVKNLDSNLLKRWFKQGMKQQGVYLRDL